MTREQFIEQVKEHLERRSYERNGETYYFFSLSSAKVRENGFDPKKLLEIGLKAKENKGFVNYNYFGTLNNLGKKEDGKGSYTTTKTTEGYPAGASTKDSTQLLILKQVALKCSVEYLAKKDLNRNAVDSVIELADEFYTWLKD